MSVRKFTPGDDRELQRLARLLFGFSDGYDFSDENVYVFDRGDGRLGGFISVAQRSWTEGSDEQPTAHIEGWYVERDLRRSGVGRKLMQAAELWARFHGFAEICSDAEVHNRPSLAAHRRMGFEPTIQLQYFRKPLVQAARRVAGHG